MIPLDYEVLHDKSQMDTAELRGVIAAAGENRPVIPVVWAHHDDGNYLGRPYTPYADFADKLSDSKASGFGIIHWTTRPLDLYFTSLSEQTWQRTKNRPLAETCQEMAERSFGPQKPASDGRSIFCVGSPRHPRSGRETSDRFIDRDLGEVGPVAEASEKRKQLLAVAADNTDDPAALERIYYYRGLEDCLVGVYTTEADFNRAKAALKEGKLEAARRAMAACRPEEVIQRFARSCRNAGITRGEQGLVVSMNLRWLTHYLRYRQALGSGGGAVQLRSHVARPLGPEHGHVHVLLRRGPDDLAVYGNPGNGGRNVCCARRRGDFRAERAFQVGYPERGADRDCDATDHVCRRSGKGPADEVARRQISAARADAGSHVNRARATGVGTLGPFR